MIRQYGAIPYLTQEGEIRVILITSASGYWIFPKGKFEAEHGKAGTAELEAFEEAGVKGRIDSKRSYRTNILIGGGKKARLILYPLEVNKLFDTWPEDSRRDRRIVNLTEADQLISWDGLKECLGSFARDFL